MRKSSLVLSFKKELLLFLFAAFPARADLTLHRVLLSAAGVGYFELNDTMPTAGTLGLDVPLDQVDDVLRSLVVFDDHGGVGSIELPGRDDAHRAFADVPFAQAMLDSPAAMFASLRGEEVAVTGPASMTGRIVSAITEPLAAREYRTTPARHTRVTLLTGEGFRQFILEDAAGVRLTDGALAARVGAALEAARAQAASSTRHFTLHVGGGHVSVGYVTAVPLWKASYRVVLPRAGGDRARVQGWAVLENQSGQDWHGVDLTLHSGNPVTFHQAIYASYYAERPEVPVDVIGRVLPNADERVVVQARGQLSHAGQAYPLQAPPAPAPVMEAMKVAPPEMLTDTAETVLDTSFHVATPIDLARGHTASVPILDCEMKAEQLDWLQAGATRPITALRLTNDGGASLPPGVLTLYTVDPNAGAAFAGDARLSGLPVGEARLLGFAEDLRMSATRSISSVPDTLLGVTVAQGIVHRTLRSRVTETVELAAPVHDARTVLVEFARSPDARISFEGGALAGVEETPHAWRVPVRLKPGQTRKLTAYADTTQSEEQALLSDGGAPDEAVLAQLAGEGALDQAARAKLAPVLDLQAELATRRAALKKLTGEQEAAGADEERLRNNLRVVVGGDLHDKMIAQLAADEVRLNDLRNSVAAAGTRVADAEAALAAAVGKLAF